MPALKIFIVGAGIGGPAAAIGLARNGHDVTIFERSTVTGEVGYAFRITPNSDRCLKHLGIDTVAGGAVSANTVRMISAEGQVVREVRENVDAEKTKSGLSVFAYRPQLHQQLMKVALESGVKLQSGIKVNSVDVAKTSMELDDGSTVSADLIIAADGAHVRKNPNMNCVLDTHKPSKQSVVRPYIVDSAQYFPHASTGHNAFRFMVPRSLVQNDSVMSPVVNDDFRMFTWAGHGKRILVYPVDYNKQFNVTCTHPEHLSDTETSNDDSAAAIAYNQKASFETVSNIYSDFEPTARHLLELADPNGFRIWKLIDMDDIPHWSLNHTVLLGDACHPVSPFGFSGASMAIEDAATLSTLLTSEVCVEDIPGRLKLYEVIRKPRVARVRETSRNNAKGLDDKETMIQYMEFLSSHNAVDHAKEALSQHLEAKSHPQGSADRPNRLAVPQGSSSRSNR